MNTTDLITQRDELKRDISDEYSEEFVPDSEYEDIDWGDPHEDTINDFAIFLDRWKDEKAIIDSIDELEADIGRGFNGGVELYTEDELRDHMYEEIDNIGVPHWLGVDYDKAFDTFSCGYSEVDYDGTTYFY